MIDNIKSDQVINQFGGRFKLTSAIQKRWLELMQGARPLIAKPGGTPLETAIQELLEGRIEVIYEPKPVDPIQSGHMTPSPAPEADE